jgi:peptidyl-tRNA hydrolase, PTH1 family
MQTIVYIGLGNPGSEYVETRHNIGWLVVDAFAAKHGARWTSPSGLYAQASCQFARTNIILCKPLTYMNASGKAAKRLLGQAKVGADRCVVVVDEYNFPVGKIHLRPRGSDGGHNGLTSMIQELGTDAFWRLRCGIDRNFGPGGMADYVLSPFGAAEQAARDGMIAKAVEALERIAKDGADRAMQVVNAA